jgi:FAD/FMN-containing dehydrogenase
MIGSLYGIGAGQTLSIQVVTADRSFITASPTSNTDLFWAIRGGGRSIFGVITSMVVKAFEDI